MLGQMAMPQMQMPGKQSNRDAATQAPDPTPPRMGAPMLNTLQLPSFVDEMPLPEVVRPTMKDGRRMLTVRMREVAAKVHRDIPPTRMWSYGPGALAPLIEARSGEPIHIQWINDLPKKHFLPVDFSLHGSGHDVPEVRAIAHMHGAKVHAKDDGYPEDWFPSGGSRTCEYPLDQDATALWFHDHAMGLNRLNVYAGLFGMMLIRDSVEDGLGLPARPYEVPLILCDRDFTREGQLLYDHSGDPEHPWIPEFSAEGILINGKLRPYFEVEPRLYRFRVVNVANSRFFLLALSNNQPLLQIGSDQGLLPAPVPVQRLVLAPAERADVLIDFSALAGKNVNLRTSAMDILQFRVTKPLQKGVATAQVPKTLRPVPRMPESDAAKTRTITLHEYQDNAARPMVMLLNRKHWHEPVTEIVKLGTTETWEFVNLTEDTHPMHLHLVRFQILDRRPFDVTDYVINKKLRFTGPAETPVANELGWKDVVQCPSGMITRIIATFEGYTGRYLYHCHILEHEANDMMRPFDVVA